jgi:hypothetical protein
MQATLFTTCENSTIRTDILMQIHVGGGGGGGGGGGSNVMVKIKAH